MEARVRWSEGRGGRTTGLSLVGVHLPDAAPSTTAAFRCLFPGNASWEGRIITARVRWKREMGSGDNGDILKFRNVNRDSRMIVCCFAHELTDATSCRLESGEASPRVSSVATMAA